MVFLWYRATGNQNAYFEGLYLSSSSAASAIVNLIPAITFVIAAIVGYVNSIFNSISLWVFLYSQLTKWCPNWVFEKWNCFRMEKLKARSWRTVAKVVGTAICVGGAASMALIKGPKLLNTQILPTNFGIAAQLAADTWLLGCVLLFVSSCFWAFWIIMLVRQKSKPLPNFSKKTHFWMKC